MRKEDLSVPALLAEAVGIIMGVVYIILQFFYALMYHIAWYRPVMNIITVILVYAALTLLSIYPERINQLSPEKCKGDIRKYSIRMVRIIKLVFISSLMIPCVCDVAGFTMKNTYTMAVIGIMVLTAIYYEFRIIELIREDNRKDK